MASRHLQGTVISRVKALLSSGALKAMPLWFEVIEAFPPLTEGKISSIPEDGRPPVITYKEDEIRDLFVEKYPLLKKIPISIATKLNESNEQDDPRIKSSSGLHAARNRLPTINNLVEKYKELMKLHGNHEAAIQQTVSWVVSEEQITQLKVSWAKQVEKVKARENDGQGKGIELTDLFNLSIVNTDK